MLKRQQAELNSVCFADDPKRSDLAVINEINTNSSLKPKLRCRSKSASPFRSTTITTIQTPFKMTQRLAIF